MCLLLPRLTRRLERPLARVVASVPVAVAVTPVVGPARRPTTRRPTQTQVRPSLVTSTKLIFHLCGRCPVRTTRPEKVSAPPTPNRHAHSVLGHRFARRSRRQTDTLITATVSPAPSLPRPPKSGVGQKLRKIVSFTFFLMGGGVYFCARAAFLDVFFFLPSECLLSSWVFVVVLRLARMRCSECDGDGTFLLIIFFAAKPSNGIRFFFPYRWSRPLHAHASPLDHTHAIATATTTTTTTTR